MQNSFVKNISGFLTIALIQFISADLAHACSIAEGSLPYFEELGRAIRLLETISIGVFSAGFLLFVINVIRRRNWKLSAFLLTGGFLSIPFYFVYGVLFADMGFCGYDQTYGILQYTLIFLSLIFICQLLLFLRPLLKKRAALSDSGR